MTQCDIVQLSSGMSILEHFSWLMCCTHWRILKTFHTNLVREMSLGLRNVTYPFYILIPQRYTFDWNEMKKKRRENIQIWNFIGRWSLRSKSHTYFQCRIETNITIDNQCAIDCKLFFTDTNELTVKMCW